jgi:hypothetical protein
VQVLTPHEDHEEPGAEQESTIGNRHQGQYGENLHERAYVRRQCDAESDCDDDRHERRHGHQLASILTELLLGQQETLKLIARHGGLRTSTWRTVAVHHRCC